MRDGWHSYYGMKWNLWRGGHIVGEAQPEREPDGNGRCGWIINWAGPDGEQRGSGVMVGTTDEAKAAVEKEI